ncbi:MAG: serine/threonine protein kinase [Deltaproteobacteria bacterium]|nr:serine/threonine protein kinase [Deltaproteobacteria bacterium]
MTARGAFGRVYRVRDRLTGLEYAAKTYQVSDRIGPFLTELNVWPLLPPHNNIVRAYHVSATADAPFLIMEYAPGGSLAGHTLRTDDLTFWRNTLTGVCRGMQHVHQHGIVHGDLKPDNILGVMRRVRLHWAVSDFGLAGMLASGQPSGPRTPAPFLSPECESGAPATIRSDIYAFGACLISFIGCPATSVSDAKSLNHRDGAPPALTVLARSCTELRPDDRPKSFEEVLRALEDAVGCADVGGEPDTTGYSVAYRQAVFLRGPRETAAVEQGLYSSGLALYHAGQLGPALEVLQRASEFGYAAENVCLQARCFLRLGGADMVLSLLYLLLQKVHAPVFREHFVNGILEAQLLLRELGLGEPIWDSVAAARTASAQLLREVLALEPQGLPEECLSVSDRGPGPTVWLGEKRSLPEYHVFDLVVPGLPEPAQFVVHVYDAHALGRGTPCDRCMTERLASTVRQTQLAERDDIGALRYLTHVLGSTHAVILSALDAPSQLVVPAPDRAGSTGPERLCAACTSGSRPTRVGLVDAGVHTGLPVSILVAELRDGRPPTTVQQMRADSISYSTRVVGHCARGRISLIAPEAG